MPSWQVQPTPGPEGEGEGARRLIVPAVVVSLAVVVVATAGVLWFASSRPGSVVAHPAVPPAVTTPFGAAGPGGLVTSAPAAGGPTGATGSGGGVSPSSTTASSSGNGAMPGTDAVASLDALLDESATARGDVASTVLRLRSCQMPATEAASVFRRASENRGKLAADATAIPVTAVSAAPEVGDAIRTFIALQRTSAQADDAFANWADEVAVAGCRGQAGSTTNWSLANRYSVDASALKARFVLIWNPIAAARGRSPRSADAI